MDDLRKDDIERARSTPFAEKVRQTFELMAQGIAMQRKKLRAQDPSASDEIIEERSRSDRVTRFLARTRPVGEAAAPPRG